ncbi:methyltransferase domain-containing protein [Rhizobiales bacterium Sp-1]|uniref:Methyltransferase domain-containing protein n=2 Tax=Segnochrobactrum spirostomi TaxID=2608987 RepID=A0A6A7Y0D0_9HYPH|nr:methyltransferase domain-containing protein [Segnochrobactrum spirostomi]
MSYVAEDVALRLAAVSRHFPVAVDLGSGGAVADVLTSSGKCDTVWRADALAAGPGRPDLVLDEEALPFAPASLDLVVATLTLQAVNDLPGSFAQIRRALKPDGLMLAAVAGGDTLTELRESLLAAEVELTGGASPRVAPFADLRALASLLQRAGFALPVADTDRLTVRYPNLFALMADLRALGATSSLTDRLRVPARRALLVRAAEIYAERFSDPDGRIRATVEIVSLSGWAPHESQQKPLAPGSAKTRLADALGATERPAGEKAGDGGGGRT